MDNCCRICRRSEVKDFIPLNYQSEFHRQTGETVLDMMNSMTGLNVSLGDELPQQLCRVCTGTIVAGYEFRNLCIESDTFFRQALSTDSSGITPEQPDRAIELNEFESYLIKLEASVQDPGTDLLVGTDLECKVEASVGKFVCCFPLCNVSYEFEESLTEHAELDHQPEKEANASRCNDDSDFRCIVCAMTFADEVELLQHRKNPGKAPPLQLDDSSSSSMLKEALLEDDSRRDKVCRCGYRTDRAWSIKRHLATCKKERPVYKSQNLDASLQGDIDDTDRTNSEIIAMGFRISRRTTMFYCCLSYCATVCETQQQLREHYQQVHQNLRDQNMLSNSNMVDIFRCSICCMGFSTEKELKIHLEDAYNPTFRCNTCGFYSISRRKAFTHALKPCRAKVGHRCSCGYSTLYQYSMKRHMLTMGCPIEGSTLKDNGIKPRKRIERDLNRELHYKCQSCDQSFTSMARLRWHTESELARALAKQEATSPGQIVEGSTTKKQYTCCWCQTVTEDCNHLVQCMVEAEKDKGENTEHKCSNCNQKFKLYRKYLEHRKSKVCLWACPTCGVKFPTRYLLHKHMKKVHHKSIPAGRSLTKLNHECKLCQRRFSRAFSLQRHVKTLHSGGDETQNGTDEPIAVYNIP